MACHYSTQTVSSCQSNVLSPFSYTSSRLATSDSKSSRSSIRINRRSSQNSSTLSLCKATSKHSSTHKLDRSLQRPKSSTRLQTQSSFSINFFTQLLNFIIWIRDFESFKDQIPPHKLYDNRDADHVLVKRTNKRKNQFINSISNLVSSARSFFKLWPFIFLIRLASNCNKFFNFFIKNATFQLFIALALLAGSTPVTANLKISIQGDILLGGIFPVHQKGNKPDTAFNTTNRTAVLCGPINKDRGIQRVEAMLFALDKINHNQSILPTIKLGAIILDTCASDTYALNQSLEFIRASVNTVESSAFECADNSTPKSRYNTKIITGVVGGSYSEVSLQVANLLRLFRIPQVSYASTTTSLSDKTRYDFFARTVPPDIFQARALVDIVANFKWTYVSIVSSEGQYGDSGLTAFIRAARSRNICIAANEKATHSANASSFDQIMESLLSKPNAKGVVLFLRMEDARGLLLAARRAEKKGMFIWIAADGWGRELKLVENVEEIALGAITVELQSQTVIDFDHYFKNLRLAPPPNRPSTHKLHTPITSSYMINTRNIWFKEYWQDVFQCKLPDDQQTQAMALMSFFRTNFKANNQSVDEQMLGDQALFEPAFESNSHYTKVKRMYENAYRQGDRQMLEKLERFRRSRAHSKVYRHHLNHSNYFDKYDFNRYDRRPLESSLRRRTDYQTFHRRRRRHAKDKREEREKICTSSLSLRDIHHKQEPKIQFVIDAVYAFAHALHEAWLVKCGGVGKICPALRDLDGGEFYNNYLLNVSFHDPVGSLVRFDKNGDGLGRYNVYNFQRSNLSSTGYHYKKIGNWSDQGLRLNVTHIYWNVRRLPHDLVPTSRCSEPCDIGEIKITQSTSETCCWICQQCRPYEYVSDKSKCEDCGYGWWPLVNKTACYELELTYIKWTSYYALVPISLAVVGILLSLFVFITFIRHLDTPIVKASGRELSFIILFGLIWCYSMTFVLLAKPSVYICALERFGVGFGFSVIYSPLLTKTNRISRIFNSARKSARRISYISPKSQVIITLALISIQIIETGIWFIIEEPGIKKDVSDEKRWLVILKCRVKDTSTLFSLVYNMLLVITCTAYAFKTRKIPENYNESKFIGFTMYTTCIIWLAFIPIWYGTGNSFEIQMTTLCVSISLSAYVTLFCLFSPKIYIIIFHPDKNIRKLTMNSNAYRKPITSSGIYFPSNPDTGISVDQFKQQHVTLEPASSVSGTGDSSSRFQSAARFYAKNSHTDSTNVSYNMPTTVTGTETSDSGYQNSNVCVHQTNRSAFKAGNKLSVMMFMPGIAAATIDRPELFYAAATGSNLSNIGIPGLELRKRSNSFTQGQTTANFLPQLDSEHIHHHRQLLYQTPFLFNNEVAQRTLEQQSKPATNDQTERVNRQSSKKNDQQNASPTDKPNEQPDVDQLTSRPTRPSKGKVNFDLASPHTNQSDDEDMIAKELNNNSEAKLTLADDDITAELASQCSVQMAMQTSGEQDEESQI